MSNLKKKQVLWFLLGGMVLSGVIIIGIVFLNFMGADDVPYSSYSSDMGISPPPMFPKRGVFHVYFGAKDGRHLAAEEVVISSSQDAMQLGRSILRHLIQGSKQGRIQTIPDKTELKAFYITQDQIAYVDLSSAIKENHPGGIQTELLTVFSIVNSLILNIPEVKRVKLLIEGQEAETLAGHIDLQHPFQADMLLIQ